VPFEIWEPALWVGSTGKKMLFCPSAKRKDPSLKRLRREELVVGNEEGGKADRRECVQFPIEREETPPSFSSRGGRRDLRKSSWGT